MAQCVLLRSAGCPTKLCVTLPGGLGRCWPWGGKAAQAPVHSSPLGCLDAAPAAALGFAGIPRINPEAGIRGKR